VKVEMATQLTVGCHCSYRLFEIASKQIQANSFGLFESGEPDIADLEDFAVSVAQPSACTCIVRVDGRGIEPDGD
jgi:hypothetical protein